MTGRTLASRAVEKIGWKIELKGWVNRRRDHGKIVFIDLRDRSGLIQLIVQPQGLGEKAQALVEEIRSEFVIEVFGTVAKRSEKTINPDLSTGTIEVQVE